MPVRSINNSNVRCRAIERLPQDQLPEDCDKDWEGDDIEPLDHPAKKFNFDPRYYLYEGCRCVQVSSMRISVLLRLGW